MIVSVLLHPYLLQQSFDLPFMGEANILDAVLVLPGHFRQPQIVCSRCRGKVLEQKVGCFLVDDLRDLVGDELVADGKASR
jgi:hypothetical protein